MGLPPFEAGGDQVTADEAFWWVAAETPVGAPGTVDGVAQPEGDDAGPVPTPLVAVTVNVYAVPLVRPVTVQDVVVPLGVVQV